MPIQVTKDISRFLSKNRARNDASNRKEFLLSLSEKRRKLAEDLGTNVLSPTESIASCARTDAKTQDRNIQMKYDIAKNEDGPLRKTMKAKPESSHKRLEENRVADDDIPTTERYPAFDERLESVETHLAVRYGECYTGCLRGCGLICFGSTFASSVSSGQSTFSRGSHHASGKAIPSLGSSALQSASQRGKCSSTPILPETCSRAPSLRSGLHRPGSHLSSSRLTSHPRRHCLQLKLRISLNRIPGGRKT